MSKQNNSRLIHYASFLVVIRRADRNLFDEHVFPVNVSSSGNGRTCYPPDFCGLFDFCSHPMTINREKHTKKVSALSRRHPHCGWLVLNWKIVHKKTLNWFEFYLTNSIRVVCIMVFIHTCVHDMIGNNY